MGLPGGVWSARWAVHMEGVYIILWRMRDSPPQSDRGAATRREGSARQRFRLRCHSRDRLQENRFRDRFFVFLLEFLVGFLFLERTPPRLHARIVVLVTHARTLERDIHSKIQELSAFLRKE